MPGFIDLHTHLREPGYESKETIETGSKAAVAGGFTTIFAMPNTFPAPDNVKTIKVIQKLIEETSYCEVKLVGAATLNREGKVISPVEKMQQAGIHFFSDDGSPVSDSAILRELLIRTRNSHGVVSDHCEELSISQKFPVNDGVVAEKLGLRGQPSSSEELQLAKGVFLASETGGHYHAQHLSSAKSVQLLRWAKSLNIYVTGEVTVHHLALTEDTVLKQGTNAKCAPPLRRESDRQELIRGIKDYTIDCIVTDHAPHEEAEKNRDLKSAPFGVTGLETAFSIIYSLHKKENIPLKRVVELFTKAPAEIAAINRGSLNPGNIANITVFDPEKEWVVKKPFYSKSSNSPFINRKLKGKIVLTFINGNRIFKHPPL